MHENDNILDRGFKHISQNGKVFGFQLDVKTGYYRGIYLSLAEGFEATMDGEAFMREPTKFRIGGRTYALDEVANLTDARWPFEETAAAPLESGTSRNGRTSEYHRLHTDRLPE
jgi:hypothetical protein